MIRAYNLTFILCLLICVPGINGCKSKTTELVTVEVPKEVNIAIGGYSEISIEVVVKEGYHVQANPASDKFLIPTTIEKISVKDVSVGEPEYPPGKPFTLEGTSSPISVYDGRFYISLPIEVPPDTQLSKSKLTGSLRYQSCDAQRCYAPRSILFNIPVKILKK